MFGAMKQLVYDTNNKSLADKLFLIQNHGLKRNNVEVFGYNSELDTIQAVL